MPARSNPHNLRNAKDNHHLKQNIRPKPRCCTSRLAAPSTYVASPSLVELALLVCFALLFPNTFSSTTILAALRILAQSIPIMTRLLLRYLCGPGRASSGHPEYSA